ncbi:acetyl-CoA carboxylase biotin carboxyl carrier protein [Terrihabitans rhizophilus]|uniref:Biotin carboxyl carrier protein of acetyl-CoA carboxylase n=1 Tax=Terrihabitans rhizophilus TaxID=3092662 RepID=A0ABU4RRN5_9HYPH|nr:acetyl-CoA carboxylase biotin carboxyl carrier protein [Terrihabitans sp. PJ23]MDX6805426.1 acetyl-CoA carboxylase biotin carboxyl carrier protein [Terrihabitans sp. PJ23]
MTKDATKSFDHELIRQLAQLLNETDLSEIEIENDDLRVRVARTIQVSAPVYQAPAAGGFAAPAAAAAAVEDKSKSVGAVLSPMVGTAYRSPEPGAKSFIEVGTEVRQGQTLLIIEAMKTMNAIPASKGGRVKEILFDDGQPVEFGQPLVIVE